MYPYLEEWLTALRTSENGLWAVLVVALASVLLLACYRWLMPDEFVKVRSGLAVGFAVVSLVLVFVVG